MLLGHAASEGESAGPWPFVGAPEICLHVIFNSAWPQGASYWFKVYPEGMRRALVWLQQQYGDIEVFITENGFTSKCGLEDVDRIRYYVAYLKQILLAIKEDKVNDTAYTAWSLMDNFEWSEGYTSKFGLYEVDFSSPERTRTPRKSAKFYKKLIEHHSLRFMSYYEYYNV